MEFIGHELLKDVEHCELETLKIHLHYYDVFNIRPNESVRGSNDVDMCFVYLDSLFSNIRVKYFEESYTTCIVIKDPIISRYFEARDKLMEEDLDKYKGIVREAEALDDEYIEGVGWTFRKKGKNTFNRLFIAFTDDGYVVDYVGLAKLLIDMRFHMEKILKEVEDSM